VNLSRPGTTVLVRKSGEGQATTVVQLKPYDLVQKLVELGAPTTMTAGNVGPFYENSATNDIKAGLFARGCVLVEGPSEQMGLPELLSRLGCDFVKLGIAVVPVGGVTNLAKWVRYFRVHGIPVYPILDSDSAKTGDDAEKAKLAREDLFRALSMAGIDDWGDVVAGPVGPASQFAVFDPDFETAMRSIFGAEYVDLERQARETLGNAKPLIARYVARSISDPPTDSTAEPTGWDYLRPLAERCAALVGVNKRQYRLLKTASLLLWAPCPEPGGSSRRLISGCPTTSRSAC